MIDYPWLINKVRHYKTYGFWSAFLTTDKNAEATTKGLQKTDY